MKSYRNNNMLLVSLVLLFAITVGYADAAEWLQMSSGTIKPLNSVWGTSSDNVYAVGSDGLILYYNGSDWTEMQSGVTSNLQGIYGTSPNNIVVVGNDGVILKYNGTKWSRQISETSENLNDVWCASETDIIVVGENGTVRHCDESSCSRGISSTNLSINGVWGSSEDDVVAVGADGLILNFDGSDWTTYEESPALENLNSVWGSSSDEIFAVGKKGTIIRYSGSSWSKMRVGTDKEFYGVGGTAEPSIYTVGSGSKIYYYSTPEWTEMDSSVPNIVLRDVWVSPDNDAFAVGSSGTILLYSTNISAENEPPTAVITISDNSGTTDTIFYVDAAGSYDAPGQDTPEELQVSWAWGDGSPATPFSTDKDANHSYDSDGTYEITLTVRDSGGLSDTETVAVTVLSTIHDNACPAEQLLGPDSKYISTLHGFRDSVLSQSVLGNGLVHLYYKHAEEISEFFYNHPEAARNARTILLLFMPAIESTVR